MTVKELIEKLQNYDDDCIVLIKQVQDYGSEAKDVRQPNPELTEDKKIVVIQNWI